MLDETDFIEGIISGLRSTKGDKCRLDVVYEELATGLKRGLKVVSCEFILRDKKMADLER